MEKIKIQSKYQKTWRHKKQKLGWKAVSWLLPNEFILPLKAHKQYLMTNFNPQNPSNNLL